MRSIAKIIGLVFILGTPQVSFAAPAPVAEDALVARAMEGQRLIFARDYQGATEVFEKLEADYPDHPIGYFGHMAVLEMRMLEKEDFHLGEEFEQLALRGNKAIVRTLNRHPSDFDLLACGSLIGLEGFYKARGKHWWDAYTLGVKSRQTFRRIKHRNPAFYDADFGLGMYLYWRSVFTKDLKFLSIFPDTRKEGIALVEGVVRNGSFAKDLAEVNLGMIWLEEQQFAKAHEIFKKFSDRYPKNILLRMFDARSLLGAKQYDDAVDTLKQVLEIEPAMVKARYFIGVARVLQRKEEHYSEGERELRAFILETPRGEWRASANYWLGRLEEQRGNKAQAAAYYEEAMRINPNLSRLKLRIRGLGSGL